MAVKGLRMSYASHYIVVEDRYGPPFFSRLIDRVHKQFGYPSTKKQRIISARGFGGIPAKFNKVVPAGLIRHEVVIIICDGHGDSKSVIIQLKTKLDKLKRVDKDKVKFIVFDTEIEEWILKSESSKINKSRKPSAQIQDYKKYNLPSYAESIDIKTLQTKDGNFKKFLELLDP